MQLEQAGSGLQEGPVEGDKLIVRIFRHVNFRVGDKKSVLELSAAHSTKIFPVK